MKYILTFLFAYFILYQSELAESAVAQSITAMLPDISWIPYGEEIRHFVTTFCDPENPEHAPSFDPLKESLFTTMCFLNLKS